MRVLFIFIFCSINFVCSAQNKTASIEPYRIDITASKTTNLIFPFAIQSVDRGTEDILVAKASGAENILHIKASRDSFPETNLTVITKDGILYSFIVRYNNSPVRLNIVFGKQDSAQVQLSGGNHQVDQMETVSKKILSKRKMYAHFSDQHSEIVLQLQGLYISSDVLFFQVSIHNRSNVSYETESIRFFIRDRQKAMRTASQETELVPLYESGIPCTIQAKHRKSIVIAVGKFSVPDNKYLELHLLEKNGDRDLGLKLNNTQIMQAKQM